MVYFSLSAMVEIASSQLICSNLPSPRLPTRFIGYSRRSGLFSQRRIERPRRQARAWKSSSPVLSVSIYCTLPSLECHWKTQSPPQLTLHWLHAMVSFASAAEPSPFLSTDGEQPNIELAPSALAATAAPANDPFTKFRRVKPRFSFSLIFPPSFRFPFKPA